MLFILGVKSGGEVVAVGAPGEIVKNRKSWTGKYLRPRMAYRLVNTPGTRTSDEVTLVSLGLFERD